MAWHWPFGIWQKNTGRCSCCLCLLLAVAAGPLKLKPLQLSLTSPSACWPPIHPSIHLPNRRNEFSSKLAPGGEPGDLQAADLSSRSRCGVACGQPVGIGTLRESAAASPRHGPRRPTRLVGSSQPTRPGIPARQHEGWLPAAASAF